MGEIISEGRLVQRESVMRLRLTAAALRVHQFGDFMTNLRMKNCINTLHSPLYNHNCALTIM